TEVFFLCPLAGVLYHHLYCRFLYSPNCNFRFLSWVILTSRKNLQNIRIILVFVLLQVILFLERCTTCSACEAPGPPSAALARPISRQPRGPLLPCALFTTSCPTHRWNSWRIPTWSLQL
ncbi:hypothetical protein GOODEAATRI_032838, partial [Goodea atripinnis]